MRPHHCAPSVQVVDADVPGPFSADVLKFRSEKDRAASETHNVLQSMSTLAANQGVRLVAMYASLAMM
jgi:hypothetical protein